MLRAAILFISLALINLAASSSHVVDLGPAEAVASLADLCQRDNLRIARRSTISKLLSQAETSTDAVCRNEWLAPLQDLQHVLDASAQDSCSLETVKRIEEFHWRYIAGTLSKSWRKASSGSIPEPLRMFFIHFADQTIQECRHALGSRLEATVQRVHHQADSASGGSMGAIINTLSIALVPESKITKFDDFFFIFESLNTMDRKKGEHDFADFVDPVTGEASYLSVKLHDATKPRSLQQKCKHELRPIYSNTVLPVMKLADLGYGYKGIAFESHNKLIAEWYAQTQFCELIVPVKFYSSPALKENQISMVSEQEAELLKQQDQHQVDTTPVQDIQVEPIQMVDIVEWAEDDHVTKRIKTNFKSRSKIYRKTLKNVLATVRSEVSSRFKKIFKFRRNKHNELHLSEASESLMAESLNDADKMLREDEKEDELLESSSELARHKREEEPELETVEEGPNKEQLKKKRKRRLVHIVIYIVLVLLLIAIVAGSISLAIVLCGAP